MIIRLSAFYQSFREGQFPVRFLGRLNHSYGYPVANFLYPGFLYIGSLIHIAGFSFVTTVKIILGVSLVSGGIWIYLWLRKFFKTTSSLFGALSFMTGPYLLFDLYSRGSVGELLAFSVAGMGLYSIELGQPWLFSLSVGLLILAHNSLAVLCIGFYCGYLLVRKVAREYFIWLVFGIGMASFFWMPALYEQKYIVFERSIISNPFDYFIKNTNIWLLGISGIIVSAILLIRRTKHQLLTYMLLIGIFSMVMATSLTSFLWHTKLLGVLFQFPFRLLSLSLFTMAWLTALYLDSLKKFLLPASIALILLWTLHLNSIYRGISYEYHPDTYYSTNEATTTVHDEYMPKWVTVSPINRAETRLEILKGSGNIRENQVTTENIDVVVDAKDESILQINTMYYPGWGVSVDGELATIDYKNDLGLIRVTIPAGVHHVIASFRETISRFIADMCSLVISIIFVIVSILYLKRKKKIAQKTVKKTKKSS